ncbi:hypothetical protein [Segetibacter aerophilus]|uniref:hypothetical protein n=1 Tax=Segetibacter aerophilus TaxID=670293 RepID=UPI0011BEB8DB|nr:hypothetical protein [Segetibacter aerophilus]
MKRITRKRLLQGLENILSEHYCKLSKKEQLILISAIDKLSRPKIQWFKMAGKILRRALLIIPNMF